MFGFDENPADALIEVAEVAAEVREVEAIMRGDVLGAVSAAMEVEALEEVEQRDYRDRDWC